MPRYVYGSFCVSMGKGFILKWICCACMYALKVIGFKFDLFGHRMIVHLEMLRSKCAHSKNNRSFVNLWSNKCYVIGDDG